MYYRHFGLAEAPFKFTPSPGALYFSAAHYEGLAALQWGFRERGGLMLLVGEIGTGKSTLIEWTLQRQQDDRVRIALVTNPKYTFAEMLRLIRSQLRIHPVGTGARAILQALKTFVGDSTAGDRVILIFDEAQGLSDEVLEQLLAVSNLTVAGGQSLQIVLVGQLDLESRLKDPKYHALQERIGFRSRLNPLKPGEVSGYIEHLLILQGGRHGIFSPEALDEIARLSGGIPRMINLIGHNAMLLAYSEGADSVDARHVHAAQADFRLLEEYEAVNPSGGFEAVAEQRPRKMRPSAIALGVVAVAAAAVAFALGLRSGRIDTLMAPAGTRVATVSGRLAKPSGISVDDSNGNRWQATRAQANSVQSARRMPPAPAPRAAAVLASGTPSVDAANAIGHPASVAKAIPGGGPMIASPRKAAAEPDVESRRSTRELAAGRKIHKRRRRWRRSQLAKRPTPAAGWAADDLAAGDRDGARPDDTADVDDGEVALAAPLSPMVKSLVQAETSEGDAHMARGDYDIALRKFRTALVLDPSDDALREKIDRAEQAAESTR